jgi:hypothetical protein
VGLDIYAGPVSRYVLGDWLTIIQQAGAASGHQVHVVRANEPEDAVTDPDVVEGAVRAWRDGLVATLGVESSWDDRIDRDYLTDKPDWDGYGSVVLLAAYDECPHLAPGHSRRRRLRRSEIPAVNPADFGQAEAYRAASAAPKRYPTLLRGVEWCLPLSDGPVEFQAPTPSGTGVLMGRVDHLVHELDELNERTLRLDPEAMEAVGQAGPPERGAPLEAMAPFGLSVLTKLAVYASEHQVAWILDH